MAGHVLLQELVPELAGELELQRGQLLATAQQRLLLLLLTVHELGHVHQAAVRRQRNPRHLLRLELLQHRAVVGAQLGRPVGEVRLHEQPLVLGVDLLHLLGQLVLLRGEVVVQPGLLALPRLLDRLLLPARLLVLLSLLAHCEGSGAGDVRAAADRSVQWVVRPVVL